MVIIVINETAEKRSTWTRLFAFSYSANTLGKGMNPTIFSPSPSHCG